MIIDNMSLPCIFFDMITSGFIGELNLWELFKEH